MRNAVLFLTLLTATPAMAHPTHVEQTDGHGDWSELAFGGLVLAALIAWFAVTVVKNPVTGNG